MKWYLSVVVALLLGTLGFFLYAKRWTPSVSDLSKTEFVKGYLQLADRPSKGVYSRPTVVDGREFVCGVGTPRCDDHFPELRDGDFVEVNMAMVHMTSGRLTWLAMTVRKSDGVYFSNEPKRIIDDWKSAARGITITYELGLVFFLLVFPALRSKGFRRALLATVAPANGSDAVC